MNLKNLFQNHWADFSYNFVIAKIHWRNSKIFFSRAMLPISTNPGTKHPLGKGIQFCSNEGPRPFPRGDNYEIAKIHWQNLQNHWINFNQTWLRGPWMIVIQSFSKGGNYEIAKISPVFSQVSDVAHGPLETFNFMLKKDRPCMTQRSWWNIRENKKRAKCLLGVEEEPVLQPLSCCKFCLHSNIQS